MDLSPERIQALTESVGMARMQEYIVIPLYCLYVYYVVTTIAEEVSIILPQQWNRGKTLYVVIRHGMLVAIALQLTAEYRNYYSMSPAICKALSVSYEIANSLVLFACDFSLGLCLSALLQAKTLYCVAILVLSCTLTIVNSTFSVVSNLQYPAALPSPLMKELGYACYYISQEDWATKTIANLGRNIPNILEPCHNRPSVHVGCCHFCCALQGSRQSASSGDTPGCRPVLLVSVSHQTGVVDPTDSCSPDGVGTGRPPRISICKCRNHRFYPNPSTTPPHQHAQGRLHGFAARRLQAPFRTSSAWIGGRP
ncbi:hypothetical protein FA13DRAFT_1819435 [Coprinellus micaceus]|uniref:Uncharacterized protein n=1 Tax=Coprinellus micaceus TaxID=71717 RepID=A0A4Y7SI58_COPMI|nr:hypothetical protein FA13DRAFT_1819435 [Coprinellus micaceus]